MSEQGGDQQDPLLLVPRRCHGTRKHGEPCGMKPMADSPWCFGCDPAKATERLLARQKAGRHRTRIPSREQRGVPIALRTAEDIQRGIELVWGDTLSQENSAQRSRTLVAVLTVAIKLLETSELEARISALEQAAGVQRSA